MTPPPKRITDPTFIYTPSASTNLRKTFARIRREMKQAQSKPANVTAITIKPTKKETSK